MEVYKEALDKAWALHKRENPNLNIRLLGFETHLHKRRNVSIVNVIYRFDNNVKKIYQIRIKD